MVRPAPVASTGGRIRSRFPVFISLPLECDRSCAHAGHSIWLLDLRLPAQRPTLACQSQEELRKFVPLLPVSFKKLELSGREILDSIF